VPGKTTGPESIRPGLRTSRSTCASTVSQEVLAPFGVARSLSLLNHVDTAGRARGLSGAPNGAKGREPRTEILVALIPMGGWCSRRLIPTRLKVRPQRVDRGEMPHPAVTGQGYGICGKLSRLRRTTFQQLPQPRRRRRDVIDNSVPDQAGPPGPFSGKRCLLDTRLLMGTQVKSGTLTGRREGAS